VKFAGNGEQYDQHKTKSRPHVDLLLANLYWFLRGSSHFQIDSCLRKYALFEYLSSVTTPVLTRELQGGCGEGGYSGARGMTSRGEGGMTSRGYDVTRGGGRAYLIGGTNIIKNKHMLSRNIVFISFSPFPIVKN